MRAFIIFVVSSIIWITANPIFANTIVYRGSSTIGQFMQAATKAYQASKFDINTRSESSGGEASVLTGNADIGGVARDVKQAVLDKGVQKFLIGKDAIGILVHPSNPVTCLSVQQLAGIFAGEITNWSNVGGNDQPIDVFIVNPRSATRSVVQKKVLGNKAYGGQRIQTIRPDKRIIDMVLNNPGALGQLSFSFLKNTNVKMIHPNGEVPTVENPNYPITRNLFLVTRGEPQGEIKAFIDWALSPAGQKVVKYQFVGID